MTQDLSDWRGCPSPTIEPVVGRYVRLDPWSRHHAPALYEALCGPEKATLWTYLPDTMPKSATAFGDWLDGFAPEWVPAVITPEGADGPRGTASFMRLRPEQGSAEIGAVVFGPGVSRTRAATEAVFLLACRLFDDLGYRRFEWKCDSRNAASRRAAERFGFTFEGTFRQDRVVKGQNRDTAWYSIIDSEWPDRRARFERWLDPANFDEAGQQRTPLG